MKLTSGGKMADFYTKWREARASLFLLFNTLLTSLGTLIEYYVNDNIDVQVILS